MFGRQHHERHRRDRDVVHGLGAVFAERAVTLGPERRVDERKVVNQVPKLRGEVQEAANCVCQWLVCFI